MQQQHHDPPPPPPRVPVANATAPGGARWTRWRGETDAAFRSRVRAEAERLGLVPKFPSPFPPGGGDGR